MSGNDTRRQMTDEASLEDAVAEALDGVQRGYLARALRGGPGNPRRLFREMTPEIYDTVTDEEDRWLDR